MPQPSASDERLWRLAGSFLRIHPAVIALSRLDTPMFFRQVISIARSLLETLIDVVFVANDEPPNRAALMRDWEQSARFKWMRLLVEYQRRAGLEVDTSVAEFVAANEDEIKSARELHWKRRTHPNRWTGRELPEDCRRADELDGSLQLAQYYETIYRRMNWSVHGALDADVVGLGMWGPEVLFVNAHLQSATFARQAIGIIVECFGISDAAGPVLHKYAIDYRAALGPADQKAQE